MAPDSAARRAASTVDVVRPTRSTALRVRIAGSSGSVRWWQAISPQRPPATWMATDIDERTPMLVRYWRCTGETARIDTSDRSSTPAAVSPSASSGLAVASTSGISRMRMRL